MEVLYPRCAGLDVHKETVVACVRGVAGGSVQSTFETNDGYTGPSKPGGLLVILVIRSGFIPRVLGVLLMVAGFAYLASSFTSLLLPRYAHLIGPALRRMPPTGRDIRR